MKKIHLIVPVLLSVSLSGYCQDHSQKDSLDHQVLQVAREIISSVGNCALISMDQEGRPRVRIMDPFPPESDFTIWFGTNPRSRKVAQIRKNPRVTLYYQEIDGLGYVTIGGTAHLINDPKEKDTRWKDEWNAFYPDKKEDYLLIKVSPEWVEVLSYSHGIVGDPVTWEPPAVHFDEP